MKYPQWFTCEEREQSLARYHTRSLQISSQWTLLRLRLDNSKAGGRLTMLTMMMAQVAGTDSSSRTPTLALGLDAPPVKDARHTQSSASRA